MDLITSIIDNADSVSKESESIKPVVIDGGFHQPEQDEKKHDENKSTAEIFTGAASETFESTAEIIDTDFENENEDFDILTEIEKKRNLLYARMYVILIDTGAGLMFQLTSGNWGEDGEKKYTISKIKREELAEAWAEVMNLEGHKKDPKTALWMMFGSFYLPLLIMAIKDRVQLQRTKKEIDEKATAAKKLKAVKKIEFEDKQSDLLEVATALEIVPRESPEEERARIEKQIEAANAITIEENPAKFPTKDSALLLHVAVDEKATATLPAKVVEKAPQAEEEETRGRKKGSRKNPKTKKFEIPVRVEKGYRIYSWGEKKKIPVKRKKK